MSNNEQAIFSKDEDSTTVARVPWIGDEPRVLVFDVNETLLDFEVMNPLFERIFGDKRALREWFGHLTMYSMTITLSGLYEDFLSLGQGLLQMIGEIHHVDIAQADLQELKTGMLTMPAHPVFERQFSIDRVRSYKPAPQVYHLVAQELDLPASSCCKVAAHVRFGRSRDETMATVVHMHHE